MNSYGGHDITKYGQQHTMHLKEMYRRKGKGDVLDWITLGMHFSKNFEEEIAFQAYYIAHLMDHEHISTNSELRFETNPKPSTSA
mmetsp:Transcript_42953/g.31365  ORF Transcript_42953/g.31365 Transcript_42953/m.31365 type:complete len:85 (-) Transcript_42953:30-284(-)